MLTPEEESRLIAAWQRDRDTAARDRIVRAYARLCYSIASRYSSNPDHVDDLAQEGAFGIMRALDRYDPTRGTRFSTYSRMWVKNFVSYAVAGVSTIVDVPARKFIEVRSGRAGEGMEAAVAASAPTVSLDATARDGETDLIERLASPEPGPGEVMEEKSTAEHHRRLVEEALSALTERERVVVLRRCLAEIPETLDQIAADFGLTRERIRQVEVAALAKMRAALEASGADPLLSD